MNYYNENDPFAVKWLRNLIEAGLIPRGDVDDRSIVDVRGADLRGYEQCHFFAGIGGWAYALQLAGWEGEAWTGSCPCQPFSVAGAGKGTDDERHLWPAFRRLIATRLPATIFGEQVASALGRNWLARVRMDLELIAYWNAFYEDLHEVLAAQTTLGLSEVLGAVAGRIEANLLRLPEGVGEGLQGAQSGVATRETYSKTRGGGGIPAGIQHEESGSVTGNRGYQESDQEGHSVRLAGSPAGDRAASPVGHLRDDGYRFQLPLLGTDMEQPVATSDRASGGIYLPEHPSRLLWDERGPGELGGIGARHDARRLVTAEEIGDEFRIAEVFGGVIEASLWRIRIAGVRADLSGAGRRLEPEQQGDEPSGAWIGSKGATRGLADDDHDGPHRTGGVAAVTGSDGQDGGLHRGSAGRVGHANRSGCGKDHRSQPTGRHTPTGLWETFEVIACGDGKSRRVAPGIPLLAHGVPNRVGRLRGYGNAIVPQVAAEFVGAYMDVQKAHLAAGLNGGAE